MPELESTSSEALLAQFAKTGSEEPFCELVRRHIGLVHSTATRLANGDTHLAEDISQIVFCDLAKKSGALPKGTIVAGWLYQHTWFTTRKMIRSDHRRLQRETEAHETSRNEIQSAVDQADSTTLRAALDSALYSLSGQDRDTLVLRFFDEQGLRRIGQSLGISEDAAQKRVSRALEKLRTILSARGITVSAAILAAALSNSAQTAAGLPTFAREIAATACANSATAAGAGAIATFLSSLKFKAALGGLLALAIAAPVIQQNRIAALKRSEAELRDRLADVDAIRAENQRLKSAAFSDEDLARIKANFAELQRLRGEVTLLRKANAVTNATALSPQAPAPAEQYSVLVEARVAELSHELLPQLQQRGFPAVADPNEFSLNLGGELVKTVLALFKDTPGVDLLTAPRIQTADGREASVNVTEERIIQGETYNVGVTVGILPHIMPDNLTIELELHPEVSIPIEDIDASALPAFRKWSGDLRSILGPGQMLVLGRTPKLTRELPGATNKLLIFCITSAVVDSRGNAREANNDSRPSAN
jgi:RNA polymerase sigma factor (sigma-70 family)